MSTHEASCSCGALRAVADGDPIRVSVCHCLACQQRTSSAFGVQARFAADRVAVSGEAREWTRYSDDGHEARIFRFCPTCGATVYWTYSGGDDDVVIPVGAFADPGFPGPAREIYDERRHPWVTVALEAS